MNRYRNALRRRIKNERQEITRRVKDLPLDRGVNRLTSWIMAEARRSAARLH